MDFEQFEQNMLLMRLTYECYTESIALRQYDVAEEYLDEFHKHATEIVKYGVNLRTVFNNLKESESNPITRSLLEQLDLEFKEPLDSIAKTCDDIALGQYSLE